MAHFSSGMLFKYNELGVTREWGLERGNAVIVKKSTARDGNEDTAMRLK